MTVRNELTGQENREDLLNLRRRRIKERRIKKAFTLTDNVISLYQSGRKAAENLYIPPKYPRIA